MNTTEMYEDYVITTGKSIFGETKNLKVQISELPEIPILKAFLLDDDLQEMTICSANIGFVRTYQKVWKPKSL